MGAPMPESRAAEMEGAPESASSRPAAWCSLPLAGPCLVAFLVYLWVPATINDPDIWWHLRNAEVQLAAHTFPRHDLFSFTAAGAPWIDHEWLAELPFYLGWRVLGQRGVYLVTLAAVEAIVLGIYFLAYTKSRSVAAAVLVSFIAAALASVSFAPRTLLFGWICLIVELMILHHAARGKPLLWLLPGLFLLWVNLHGSWLIGMVLLLVFTACTQVRVHRYAVESPLMPLRPLAVCTGASLAALFGNPYGWRLVAYPFNLAFRQKLNVATVAEWRALDFHSPRGRILLASLALLFVMQIVRRRCWQLEELFFVALGVYASFSYSRFLFLAAILIMPVLAKHLPFAARDERTPNYPWINGCLIVAIAGAVALREAQPTSARRVDDLYPIQATAFLRQFHPRGNVFNEYLWGGYLEWHVRQIPVFIDSRVDLFEYNGTFRDYLDIIRLHNTFELLDKYTIQYVLFEEDTPLCYLLAHSRGWKVAYHDGRTILFERVVP